MFAPMPRRAASPKVRTGRGRWHTDAFVFGSTEIGDESLLSGKLGKHNVYWGESILAFAHGNSYGQAGLDLTKALTVPGTESKELFIPRKQLSTSLTVNSERSEERRVGKECR